MFASSVLRVVRSPSSLQALAAGHLPASRLIAMPASPSAKDPKWRSHSASRSSGSIREEKPPTIEDLSPDAAELSRLRVPPPLPKPRQREAGLRWVPVLSKFRDASGNLKRALVAAQLLHPG